VGDVSLTQLSTCSAASPCTRFSRAPSTTSGSDFHYGVCLPVDGPFSRHTRPPCCAIKTAVDLPGSVTLSDACARSQGGFLARIETPSARTTTNDNMRTMLNVWVQQKLPSWRGLGDEMAKRPLKTHTV